MYAPSATTLIGFGDGNLLRWDEGKGVTRNQSVAMLATCAPAHLARCYRASAMSIVRHSVRRAEKRKAQYQGSGFGAVDICSRHPLGTGLVYESVEDPVALSRAARCSPPFRSAPTLINCNAAGRYGLRPCAPKRPLRLFHPSGDVSRRQPGPAPSPPSHPRRRTVMRTCISALPATTPERRVWLHDLPCLRGAP